MNKGYSWPARLDRAVPTRQVDGSGRIVTAAGLERGAIRPRTPDDDRAKELDRREAELAEREAAIDKRYQPNVDPDERQQDRDEFEADRRARDVLQRADEIDRKYLIFPEAGNEPSEQERAVALIRGRTRKENSDVEQIADFTRAILHTARGGHAHDFAKQRVNVELLKRVHNIGTPGDGGYLVPPGYVDYLFKEPPPFTSLFDLAFTLPVPGPSGTAPSVVSRPAISYGTENVAIDPDDAAFSEVTYTCVRRNVLAKFSKEVFQDSAPNIVQVVSGLINEALADERERCVAMGTGSGQPTGLYYSTSVDDVSGVTAVNWANLNTLFHSVHSVYINDPSCVWTMNRSVLAAIRGLLDEQNRPILTMDPALPGIERLFGKPIVVNEHFPNVFIGFGAMNGYVVFDRRMMTMDATDQAGDAFEKFQTWLRLTERVDGKYVRPTSKKRFVRSKVLTGVTALG